MKLTPFQVETLTLIADVKRDLRRLGNYMYAWNPPCPRCEVALGSTEDCPTCAEKRAQGAAADSP